MNKSQLAMEIARLKIEQKNKKRDWMSRARASFLKEDKQPCCVCGLYQSLSHAHHVIPLSIQFDRDFDVPNHEHVWLCPNHHELIHVQINALVNGDAAIGAGYGISAYELDAVDRINVRFVELLFSNERSL